MSPLSLEQLKASAPMKICSECNMKKPIYEFPSIEHGLKTRPGPSCLECTKKRKEPKKEPEVVGVSKVKPLLEGVDKVLAEEGVQVEPRYRECKECQEFKELEEFDSSKTICEECYEDLKLQKQLEENKKISDNYQSTNPEVKICNKCDEEKHLSEYYFNKKGNNGQGYYENVCKKCKYAMSIERRKQNKKDKVITKKQTKTQQQETMEKKAMELYNDKLNYIRKSGRVTIDMMHKKVNYAKSTVSQHLKLLAEKGLLEVVTIKKRKYYSLPEIDHNMSLDEPKKEDMGVFDFDTKTGHDKTVKTGCSGYDCITDAMPNAVPKKELKDTLDKGVVKSTMPKKEDPITQPLPPENKIMDIVKEAYGHAESIQINPESHEITIKMKGESL